MTNRKQVKLLPNPSPASHIYSLIPSAMNHQQQGNNVNGNGAGLNAMPMIAGQQMDVNFLFQRVLELSELLKENRERTQGIIAGAEELAVWLSKHCNKG